MSATKSKRFVKSNYTPLVDGIDADREADERHALSQINKKESQSEPIQSDLSMTPVGVGQPVSRRLSAWELFAERFDLYVRWPDEAASLLYVSEKMEVIGFDGPEELAVESLDKYFQGFRRTFFKLTPELWKTIVSQGDELIGKAKRGEISWDEIDDLFQKLEPVTDRAAMKGWPS